MLKLQQGLHHQVVVVVLYTTLHLAIAIRKTLAAFLVTMRDRRSRIWSYGPVIYQG